MKRPKQETKEPCPYHSDKECPPGCDNSWPKCAVCGEILPFWNGDDIDNEINGYAVWEGLYNCSDHENESIVQYLCFKCYRRIFTDKELESTEITNLKPPAEEWELDWVKKFGITCGRAFHKITEHVLKEDVRVSLEYNEKLIIEKFNELNGKLAADQKQLDDQAKSLAIYADNDKLYKEQLAAALEHKPTGQLIKKNIVLEEKIAAAKAELAKRATGFEVTCHKHKPVDVKEIKCPFCELDFLRGITKEIWCFEHNRKMELVWNNGLYYYQCPEPIHTGGCPGH